MRRSLGTGSFVLMLAACAAPSPRPAQEASPAPEAAPASATAGATGPPGRVVRAGTGTVESASVLSLSPSASAAAGGTAGPATSPTMAYRVQMADGTTQSIVQAGERFAVGDRVSVTSDGRLTRP
jgi:hypothetical protein